MTLHRKVRLAATGGVGSVFGTLIGVLLIGIILNVITTYEGGFSSGTTKVAIGAALLLFVLLQRLLTGGAGSPGARPDK